MPTWESFLSLKCYGDTYKRIRKEQDNIRLGFEVDYDRVIFSSESRILQDKTQGILLSKTDFVYTRLTHSLEVCVVGISLGRFRTNPPNKLPVRSLDFFIKSMRNFKMLQKN